MSSDGDAILVVGGAGYIGSHMTRAIAHHHRAVAVLDDLSTGFRDAVTVGMTEGSLQDRQAVLYTLPAEDYVFFPSRLEELKRQPLLIEAIRSGEERSVRGLLERMMSITGVTVPIRQDPAWLRPSEQRAMRGDNGKISRLGWRPQCGIDEALREILHYWESRIRNG